MRIRIAFIILWFVEIGCEILQLMHDIVSNRNWDFYVQCFVLILVSIIGPIALILNKRILVLSAYLALTIDFIGWFTYLERAQSISRLDLGIYTPFVSLIAKMILTSATIVVGGFYLFQEKSNFNIIKYLRSIPATTSRSLNSMLSLFIVSEIIFLYFSIQFKFFEFLSIKGFVILLLALILICYVIGIIRSNSFTLYTYCIAGGLFIHQMPNLINRSIGAVGIALTEPSFLFSDYFIGHTTGAICFAFSLPAFIFTLRRIDPSMRVSETKQLDQF